MLNLAQAIDWHQRARNLKVRGGAPQAFDKYAELKTPGIDLT